MYQLLIVDDEVISRLGISHLLDWEAYGFSLVESVGNGKEALEMMEMTQIDLVITDVKMPIVDGIELLKEAKIRGFETKFILMSAYDDFQYVREGLTRGALDYVLKCEMNQEHIVPLLEKASCSLRENQNANHSVERSEGTIKEARRSVLKRLLFGRFEGNAQVKSMCEEVQISLEQEEFCVISFQLTGALAKQSARVVGFIGDILQDYPQSYICETMLNEMTILCNPSPSHKKEVILEELQARLIFFVKQYFNSNIKLLVSPWVNSLDQIPKCYLQAQRLKEDLELVNENETDNNYIVRMAKQYVEKHYTEGIKIKEVAEQIGVSNSYLSTLFHQVAGVTLKEYSQQLQFKKAKQLLRETNEMVSEIAYQVGYENEQQFTRVFKQRIGRSPTSYRNGRV